MSKLDDILNDVVWGKTQNTRLKAADNAKQAIIDYFIELVGDDEQRNDAQDRVALGIDVEEERMKVHRNRLRAELRQKIKEN